MTGQMKKYRDSLEKECHLLRNSLHFKEESVTLINDNTMT